MNPLLEDLNADQLLLLDTVAAPGRASQGWPLWDYVERVLYRDADLDAAAVFATLPKLPYSETLPGSAYGLVWSGGAIGASPRPEDPVGLTVAGFYHLQGEKAFGDAVLRVVRTLADRERQIVPDPHALPNADFTSAEYDALLGADGKTAPAGYADLMREVLQHEPPTWGTVGWSGAGTWTAPLSPRLRAFRGVQTIEDYMDRVVAAFPPPKRQGDAVVLPPMAIPDALGYLDVVWRLREGRALIGRAVPGPFARLALSCSDPEGFDSRMTALAEVFATFECPDVPGLDQKKQPGTLERLRRHLLREMPEESHARTEDAIGVLKAAVRIRAGGQHTGAAVDAAKRFIELGIRYPPTDWGDAWDRVRARVVAAVDAIRETIQLATDS